MERKSAGLSCCSIEQTSERINIEIEWGAYTCVFHFFFLFVRSMSNSLGKSTFVESWPKRMNPDRIYCLCDFLRRRPEWSPIFHFFTPPSPKSGPSMAKIRRQHAVRMSSIVTTTLASIHRYTVTVNQTVNSRRMNSIALYVTNCFDLFLISHLTEMSVCLCACVQCAFRFNLYEIRTIRINV